jgi:DNA/RNA endonuclease YhcR with UshA esterase domain
VAEVSARSSVTYLNLDRPYPNHTLALVIWQSDLPAYESRFGNLSTLRGKRVCALGMIEQYRNGLQIIMKNALFLRLMTS